VKVALVVSYRLLCASRSVSYGFRSEVCQWLGVDLLHMCKSWANRI
jgi:hypothetical protein